MGLLLRKEGIFTSLQDLGRFGRRRFGVPPGGAMDRTAARIANLLVGNDESAAVLELHYPGPEIVFDADCIFALTGADFDAQIDGSPAVNWRCHIGRESAVLRFSQKHSGNRCYLAVRGGFPHRSDALSDRRTDRLLAGHRLPCLPVPVYAPPPSVGIVSHSILPAYSRFPTVRALAGAEFPLLIGDNNALESAAFTLSRNSDRMGFRLEGPPLSMAGNEEMVSSPVDFGTIQLLPDGQLIVLMADHQTTGGYPRLGHIITADLPLAGQLGPGDGIGFKIVEIDEAERACAQLERDIHWLKTGLRFAYSPAGSKR